MSFDLRTYPSGPESFTDAARIQSWRHTEEALWNDLVPAEDVAGVLALLQMTEPEALSGLGPPDRLLALDVEDVQDADWVVPVFAWSGPGRFNDHSHGCFYAAAELETAVAETVYHQETFLRATEEPAVELRMRVLRTDVGSDRWIDLRGRPAPASLYDPDDYTVSRTFGNAVRATDYDGILSPSVRRTRGTCIALFEPNAIQRCRAAEALAYLWDGSRIHVEQRTPFEWT